MLSVEKKPISAQINLNFIKKTIATLGKKCFTKIKLLPKYSYKLIITATVASQTRPADKHK
jgi:hypothetical protein